MAMLILLFYIEDFISQPSERRHSRHFPNAELVFGHEMKTFIDFKKYKYMCYIF